MYNRGNQEEGNYFSQHSKIGKGHDFQRRSIRIKTNSSFDYRLILKIYIFPCFYRAPGSSHTCYLKVVSNRHLTSEERENKKNLEYSVGLNSCSYWAL